MADVSGVEGLLIADESRDLSLFYFVTAQCQNPRLENITYF